MDPHDLVDQLVARGVDGRTARDLVEAHAAEQIQAQLAWADARGPARNPAGRLVKSIRERWSEPLPVLPAAAPEISARPGEPEPVDAVEFARGCYAGTAGVDPEDSVAEPDPLDIRGCNRMVKALLSRFRHIAGDRDAGEWGWALGRFVSEYRRLQKSAPLGLTAARMVAIYGDAFLQRVQRGPAGLFRIPAAASAGAVAAPSASLPLAPAPAAPPAAALDPDTAVFEAVADQVVTLGTNHAAARAVLDACSALMRSTRPSDVAAWLRGRGNGYTLALAGQLGLHVP